MTARTFAVVDTPDGPFALLADPDGAVVAAGWTADLDALLARLPERERGVDVVSGASEHTAAVEAFYAGEVAAIDTVPVRQWGTPLQQRGWAGLRSIAAGHPLTYAEFAVALGSPTAVRAAASICARNAPALFVPCHRVLRTGGAMGGFAWGVEVKRSLLAREAAAR